MFLDVYFYKPLLTTVSAWKHMFVNLLAICKLELPKKYKMPGLKLTNVSKIHYASLTKNREITVTILPPK